MKKYTPETGALDTVALEASNSKILFATLAALIIAGLILLTIILPAEFNRDPLGVGQILGLKGLSESTARPTETVQKQPDEFHRDTVSFELLPFEYVEYKYELSQDSALLYSWTATDILAYDFHGEAHDTPEPFEKSFSAGKGSHENGAFIAPFNGIHGWFWENRGTTTVKVTLKAAGFYTASLEFRDGDVYKKDVSISKP